MDCCEVFLPPQIFLVFRSHCWHHVIKVHYNMHHIVYQIWECAVTSCKKKLALNIHQKLFRIFGFQTLPAKNLTHIHVSMGVSEWWYKCSKLIWLSFFRSTKNIWRKKKIYISWIDNKHRVLFSKWYKQVSF